MLEGAIVEGQVSYRHFMIDDQRYILDLTIPPASDPGEPNRLAIAIQIDGNTQASAYDLFVDMVDFKRERTIHLYLPLLM